MTRALAGVVRQFIVIVKKCRVNDERERYPALTGILDDDNLSAVNDAMAITGDGFFSEYSGRIRIIIKMCSRGRGCVGERGGVQRGV